METYSESRILLELESLPGWKFNLGALERTWVFPDFNRAMGFMVQVGMLSEKADHHPEMNNVYNRVTLRLNTHSAKGITRKDFDLATAIQSLG